MKGVEQMNLLDKILKLLGIRKEPQLPEAKGFEEIEKTGTQKLSDSISVSQDYINQRRIEQQKDQQRKFQLMFCIKNICGKGLDNFEGGLSQELENKLAQFGYNDTASLLTDLDLKVLSTLNLNMNYKNSDFTKDNIVDYISSSQNPSETASKLIESVEQFAINEARSFQYTDDVASRFVPGDVLTLMEKKIDELSREDSQNQL